MNTKLDDWSYLWDEDKDDYALLVTGENPETSAVDVRDCLIYNVKEHFILKIDNEEIANELMCRMLNAGSPTITKSMTRLADVEIMINRMLESGATTAEVNQALKELRDQEKGRGQ